MAELNRNSFKKCVRLERTNANKSSGLRHRQRTDCINRSSAEVSSPATSHLIKSCCDLALASDLVRNVWNRGSAGRLASWLRLMRQLVELSRQLICFSSALSSPTTVLTCRLLAFLLLSLDIERWKLTVEEVSETGVVVLLVRVSFLVTLFLKQRLGVATLWASVGVKIEVCEDKV